MTQVKPTNRVLGSLFSVSRLLALGEGGCNLLLVSDRTLYLLERFARNEVNWAVRYADQFVGSDQYVPVTAESPNFDLTKDVARVFRLEVNDMSCDLIAAINNVATAISEAQSGSCTCEIGSDVETTDGQEGGALPDPVNGQAYTEPSAIPNRKCLASNYVHQSTLAVVTELKLNRADQYGFAGLAFVLSLVATIVGGLLAGPIGLLAGAVVGSFLSMATLLFKASFSLVLLETAILADQTSAICALYNATSASGARADYLTVLSANGATSLEIEFVEHLLTNNVLNLLFFGWGDSEDTIAAVIPTIDCTACAPALGCPWEFVVVGVPLGSGDLTKDGTSRVLTSVPYGGGHLIAINMHTDSGSSGQICEGENYVNSSMYITSCTAGDAYSSSRGYWDGSLWVGNPAAPPIPFTGPMDWAYFELYSPTQAFTAEYILYPGNT